MTQPGGESTAGKQSLSITRHPRSDIFQYRRHEMGKASRRKADKRSQGVRERATNVIQAIAGTQEIRVRSNLPQEEKISHALSALLEAEVPEGSPLAEYKAALNFIVIAWNISLLNADKQFEALQEFTAAIGGADDVIRHEARDHIERLIARKRMLFPHDKRTIVSWDVWFRGESIRVSAAAFAPPP